jgi:hypothetical protein
LVSEQGADKAFSTPWPNFRTNFSPRRNFAFFSHQNVISGLNCGQAADKKKTSLV